MLFFDLEHVFVLSCGLFKKNAVSLKKQRRIARSRLQNKFGDDFHLPMSISTRVVVEASLGSVG